MPDGDFRRPPLLWEQKIANLVAVNAIGSVSGGGTTEVNGDLPPGDGGPAPDPEPIAPTPVAFLPPSTPTVAGTVQGLRITWDGNNNAGEAYPPDASVEVHVSTTSGFTPGAATLQGRLLAPGTFTAFGLTASTTYYVRLVGVDAYGNITSPSAQASSVTGFTTSGDYGSASIQAGAVSFNARQIGGITTTVGTTAPSSPVTGDIWLDSSPLSATVSSASGNGARITYTCSTEHPFAVGDSVTITGMSSGSFNRTGTILSDPAPTATTFALTATVSGSASGGTASGPTRGLVHKRWSGSAWVKQEWGPDALAVGTITARQIAAGAITAGAIAADAITGKTITGGTIEGAEIRSASSGRRVVIGKVGETTDVQFVNSSGGVASIGIGADNLNLYAGTNISGGQFVSVMPFKVQNNFKNEFGTAEFEKVTAQSNQRVIDGYRTTTGAGDVIMRLSSNVTNTNEAKFEVDADGDVKSRTNSYAGFSDARYKENVMPSRNYLDDLRQVEIVTFNWKGSDHKLLGVTAQQVQPIFPNLVAEDKDGTLSVRYSVFVPMLITAVQSLADKVESLAARIDALEGA